MFGMMMTETGPGLPHTRRVKAERRAGPMINISALAVGRESADRPPFIWWKYGSQYSIIT